MLTPEEQAELQSLEAELGTPQGGLTQAESAELQSLEAELGQSPDKQYNRMQSGAMGALDAATVGLFDEAVAKGAAINESWADKLTGGKVDYLREDAYDENLNLVRGMQEQAMTDNPVSYGSGQVAGSMIPATHALKGMQAASKVLPSVAKLGKYARAHKYQTAFGAAGTSGGLYGFGSGEGGAEERAKNAGVMAGVSAPLGLLGARVGQAVGDFVAPLARNSGLLTRAQALLGKSKPQQPQMTVQPVAKSLSEVNGEILPMTRGQATQNPKLQSLETGSRKGAYGDSAQDMILRSDIEQQGAIRGVIDDIGAGGDETLTGAGKQVQQAYKSQKAKVGQAYDKADTIKQVYVNKTPIQEQFIPKFKETLSKFNLDESDLSEAGRKLSQDLQGIKGDKITAVNLARMEKWRGKASNIIANNNQIKGNATEGAAFRKVVDEYDTFMAKLPEDALKSGDEDALQAILKARGERRKQGVLFERDKTVKKIVQSQDLTDEELANMVLTGTGNSGKINSGSGRLVRNLKRAVGDNAPALQEGLKRGTLGRILQKGTTTVTEGNSTTRMLSPAKLRKELDGLLQNKTFMKEVFCADEIAKLQSLHRDLVKIGSEQAGTNNYSNTAYTIMRGLNSLPMGLSSIGGATAPLTKAVGNKGATRELKKNLSPVIEDMISELTAQRRFYGAASQAPATSNLIKE